MAIYIGRERDSVEDYGCHGWEADRSGCGEHECNGCLKMGKVGEEVVCLEAYCRGQGSPPAVVPVDYR